MKTVLIIEDNLEIRENAAELLELEGYSVIIAADGNAGEKLAKEKLPDLIICDIMMPGITGYEVLERLKQNNATSTIPFIFASASAEKKEIQEGLNKGAQGYLAKPFTHDDLMSEIRRWLKK
ncbi:MAG: response regulator [Bacteroidia bacterium]